MLILQSKTNQYEIGQPNYNYCYECGCNLHAAPHILNLKGSWDICKVEDIQTGKQYLYNEYENELYEDVPQYILDKYEKYPIRISPNVKTTHWRFDVQKN